MDEEKELYQSLGSDLREINDQIQRPGSQSYRWGFYLYRTTYDNQPLWERYIAHIHERITQELSWERNSDELRSFLRLTVIEDPSLNGASVEEVQERFRAWVAALPEEGDEQQEIPPFDRRDNGRFAYCLYVDEECLQSFQAHAETDEASGESPGRTPPFVKVINAERLLPDPEEGEYSDDEEDSEEDYEEEHGPEYNWILLSCEEICVFYDMITLGCEWDRQYRICSYPEKRPWTND